MKNTFFIIYIFSFFACTQTAKNEATKIENANPNEIIITKQQFASEQMQLGTFEKKDFKQTIKANGMFDVPPENKATISSYASGYVTKIPLLIGDFVKKGTFIATLSNPEFIQMQQDYVDVVAQLGYLKNEFERQKKLFDEKIASEKNYLKAESNYKSNLAMYQGLRKKLQMMNLNPTEIEKGNFSSSINIYAPIDGFISQVNVNNGAFVSAANTIVEIVNTNHLHIELNVFEKDILEIKKEQSIIFKVPEVSIDEYAAKIHLVGTTINNDRTVKVHGHLERESKNFIPGMFVEANIIIKSKTAMALPNSAIMQSDNKNYILFVKQEKSNELIIEKINVEIGLKEEDYSEILNFENLKGKQILINGGFML